METKTVKPAKDQKARNTRPKSRTHPPVAKMVNEALENLNDKHGSSVKAIKKYVAANFVVDLVNVAPFIKKYLTKAVENKLLLQTTGKGLNGSYKLASVSVKKKKTISIKRHVTASGSNKEEVKKKPSRKLSPKLRKPPSKRQSREDSRKSVEKKMSKLSNVSVKVEKMA